MNVYENINNKTNSETEKTTPTENELELIYQSAEESRCQNFNEWTNWNSLTDPSKNNGDDFETLQEHRLNNRSA